VEREPDRSPLTVRIRATKSVTDAVTRTPRAGVPRLLQSRTMSRRIQAFIVTRNGVPVGELIPLRHRSHSTPATALFHTGFRCAKDLPGAAERQE